MWRRFGGRLVRSLSGYLLQEGGSGFGISRTHLQPHSATDRPFHPGDIGIGQEAFDASRLETAFSQESLRHVAELSDGHELIGRVHISIIYGFHEMSLPVAMEGTSV